MLAMAIQLSTVFSNDFVTAVRLNSDGSLDSSFDPGDGANNSVRTIALQKDGKILIGGDFTLIRGEARNRIARLNADGTLDSDFNPPGGINSSVLDMELQSDGQILIGGAFTQVAGQTRNYVARLRSNGTLDPGFTVSLNSAVHAVRVTGDGKIIIGGAFTDGGGGIVRNRVARLHGNGTLDMSFDPAEGPNSTVEDLAVQPDGRIVIGGHFGAVNSIGYTYLARLNADGLVDNSFGSTANNIVYAVALQPDGKILVGGEFAVVGGQGFNRLARLRANGSADPSFDVESGANTTVRAVVVQPDGNIVVGGNFTQWSGQNRLYLARVQGLSAASGGELEFSAGQYTVAESQPSAVVTVRRGGNTSSTVTVDFATIKASANAGDYTAQSDTLTFGAGETTKTFTIPIRSDTNVEGDETVDLTLSNPTGDAVLGSQRTAVLVIADDDFPSGVGSLDGSFTGQVNAISGTVHGVAVQPDGKLVVTGNFGIAGGMSRLRIARFNPDGTVDPGFLASAWLNNIPRTVVVQPDGRILLAGDFTVVNGVARNRLARLRANGTLDTSFNVGAGPNSTVHELVIEPDGDILVGGAFSQFDGQSRAYLTRLYNDGSIDTDFNASLNSTAHALSLMADGKVVIGGSFTTVNGQVRNRVARLNGNGSLDTSFDPAEGPNSTVQDLAIQPDGKIVIGGHFGAVNSIGYTYIARLNADGLVDNSFGSTANNVVYCVALQPDGKILAGGEFTTVGGQTFNRLARLQANGSPDPSFEVGVGANAAVQAVVVQPDGNIVIGGNFTQFAGLSRTYLARVQGLSTAGGGELEFSAGSFTVSESQASAVITVKRTGNTGASVAVDYATSSGNANPGDYTPQSATLRFGAGETTKTFTVPIRADTNLEGNEYINLALSNPTGGATLGSQRTATLTIVDDDFATGIGSVDASFEGHVNGTVHDMATQPDGKVVVVGEFSTADGLSTRLRIARFNTDGSVDSGFFASAWLNNIPRTVVIQPDGRILIGGDFTIVNGATRNRVARLRDDGTLDSTFNVGAGSNGTVHEIVLEPDGDILVGRAFSQFDGQSRAYLMRLFSDGSVDTDFSVSLNSTVHALDLTGDGKVVIGGSFTIVNGQGRNRVARLNANGSLDTSFDPAEGPNSTVEDLAIQPDGKIVIGGHFGAVNSIGYTYLARLNTDGLVDNSFASTANNVVYAVALQPDGKILVGGEFTLVGGQGVNRLARLRPDGSFDPSFQAGGGANATVRTVLVQPDGNIMVGGAFTQWNGLSRLYLARLQGLSAASGGELEFSAPTYRVNESQPSVVVAVRRSGNTSSAVTVDYATGNGSAKAGDYTTQSGTLVFGAGETTKTFTVPIRADTTVESDENFDLTLTNPTGGAELGSQRTALVWIDEDDSASGVGSVDGNFEGYVNGAVYAVAVQTDGKVIVAGEFSTANGLSTRLRVARFNSDGTVDPSFLPSVWLNSTPRAVVVQPDGKILLGGDFTLVNGVTRNRLARLRADGTLDNTFNVGAGPNGTVHELVLEPDGDVLVGGAFSQFDGQSRTYLTRLFNDGSIDSDFNASLNSTAHAVGLMADGKVVIGGSFTTVNGQVRNRVAKLNANGSLDTSFDPADGPNSTVEEAAIQPDGKIVIGGHFGAVRNQSRVYLARLNPDGTLDESFPTGGGPNGIVYSLALQADGKIFVGGNFTTYGGATQNYLARLNADGSIDPAFAIGAGPNAQVNVIKPQANGAVLVGGNFMQFNGLSRSYLVRLQGDVTVAEPVRFDAIVYGVGGSVTLTISGKAGQRFAMEASEDLQGWIQVRTGTISNLKTTPIQLDGVAAPLRFFRTVNLP